MTHTPPDARPHGAYRWSSREIYAFRVGCMATLRRRKATLRKSQGDGFSRQGDSFGPKVTFFRSKVTVSAGFTAEHCHRRQHLGWSMALAPGGAFRKSASR